MYLRKAVAVMVLCLCMLFSACGTGAGQTEQEAYLPSETNRSDVGPRWTETNSILRDPRQPERATLPAIQIIPPSEEAEHSTEDTRATIPVYTQPSVQTETAPEPTPEVTVYDEAYDCSRTEYNIGSCRTLKEDAAVIVLFADDDQSSWDDEAIRDAGYEVEAAVQVLRETAAAYDYTLELPIYYYYSQENRDIRYDGVIMTGGEQLDALENIAKVWGFQDKWDMHAALQRYTGMDQLAYFVVHNKAGYCFTQAETHMGNSSDWEQPEYCVISTKAENGWHNQAETYLHEMLHLFGAQDFYQKGFGDTTYNAARQTLARKLCPNEVMLCDCWDIDSVEISGFTAYCVGWIDFLPTNYDCDDWWVDTQWEKFYTP